MCLRNLLEPVFSDIGVIALVPDDWDALWHPRHQVISRLSHFFPTVWLEPASPWREFWRNPKAAHTEPAAVFRNLTLYRSGAWPPAFYRPGWLARFSFRDRLQRARKLLLRQNCKKIILYIWRPTFAPSLDLVPHDLSCYHIDDEYSFSSKDGPNSDEEIALLRRVDQVFIHSRMLLEKKGAINSETSYAPNGVDYEAYAKPVPEPADLAAIPHPRIGYTGFLKKQLDWELLLSLSGRHANWSFIFVGPQHQHPEMRPFIEQLSKRRNVHFLGAKPTEILAGYPQHFDVSIMPYRLDGYTRYIYPLKLHEYLAAGPPVVGAQVPALEEFSDVIALPRNEQEWSVALSEALGPEANSGQRRAARQAVARQYDWDFIVYELAETLASRIRHRQLSRLDQPSDAHRRGTQGRDSTALASTL